MTLRIEKSCDRQQMVLRLSGRLQAEHREELMRQIPSDQPRIVFDLDEVTLLDVEIVRFLNTCMEHGIELLNCPPYIREWMRREQDGEG